VGLFLPFGKIFRPRAVFLERQIGGKLCVFSLRKKKKKFDATNLYEIFYVMKVIGKIPVGVFLIGRINMFHFRPFLEFSDWWFRSY
jgi:hypothetical protein